METSDQSFLGSPDNPRTAAVVGYITIIGWLFAYFALYRPAPVAFSAFHLRQALLLYICSILVYAWAVFVAWNRVSEWAILVPALLLGVLWAWGLLGALTGSSRPVPLIGRWAQSLFRKL